MRQTVVMVLRARLVAGALALAGCSFDTGAMPAREEQPVAEENDAAAGRPAPPPDAGRVLPDAMPPALIDAEPQPPVRPDEPAPDAAPPATPDAAPSDMDAAADATAADDDAAVDEPDASEPCEPDPGPCVCPHVAISLPTANDQCAPMLCPVDECAPDDDCRFLRFASSGYYFCNDERSWEDARDRCFSIENAHLVIIESADEDQFVFESISDKTWLGGNDREQEGRWRWSAGSAFYDEEDGPINGAFENWHESEPNDTGLSESVPDCLMYWFENAAWADASCGDPHGYVCEVD